MKKYDTEFIKKYIEEHKSEIDSVECGMQEDWIWTAETVFDEGPSRDPLIGIVSLSKLLTFLGPHGQLQS